MKRPDITTFEAAVKYLYDMPRFTSKNTLEDTKEHLVKLGAPDRKLKTVVHVAGTNGKGSVCAYLKSILEEAGQRVAVFTSPHLVDVRERFVIAGEMISKETFLEAFLTVLDSLDWAELEKGEGYHPTFFEYLFFMAMLIFARENPDCCILETGLGGRLDATNAVTRKDLTVITRIGLDHTEYLGNTLAEIAGEKAGIMMTGVPCVYADEVPEASAVFVRKADNLKTKGYPLSKNDYTFLNFKNKTIDFSLHTRYYGCIRVSLSTSARYQMENASLAVRAVEVLDGGKNITVEHIRSGLRKAFWAGRMEEVLPEVYVDGAHNEDGIRAFLDTVSQDGCEEAGFQRTLLFSVVRDKDSKSMVSKLMQTGLFSKIAVAQMSTGRAVSLDELKELFGCMAETDKADGKSVPVEWYEDVRAALEELLLKKQKNERIYIAGSLYLAGEIKEFLKHD